MAITPADWSRVCPIVIQAGKVSGTHTDFTVVLDENNFDSEIFSIAKADLGDLRICLNLDGTNELARGIIRYNAGSEYLLVNVKIPSLSGEKTIYAFYGNAGASDYAHTDTYGAHNALPSSCVLWMPLWEVGGGSVDEYEDYSSNHNHGRGGGGQGGSYVPTQSPLLMNAGQDFDEASSEFIEVDYDASLDLTTGITACIYGQSDTTTPYNIWLWRGNNIGALVQVGFHDNFPVSGKMNVYIGAVGKYITSVASLNNNLKQYVVTHTGSASGTNVSLYIDGSEDNNYASGQAPISNTTDPLTIGAMTWKTGGGFHPFDGKLAFVELYNTAQSADWVDAHFNNLSDTGTFAIAGTPQSTSVEKSYAQLID